eukprot:scaffold150882_cov19-Tisochrysis_lutea.AAC.2
MHQLDNVPPAQGLGAMSGGVGPDGENLPRGGGEEGGLRGPPSDRPSLKHQASMAAKVRAWMEACTFLRGKRL